MRYLLPFLLCLLAVAQPAASALTGDHADNEKNCRTHAPKMDCESGPDWCTKGGGLCSPEMRGRCGKRRGDWYGARQPVNTLHDAQGLLQSYFAGQEYSVSGVTENRWGFKAEIVDKNGNVIDKVMIDKRSGRIRSIY
jgi:hypothetical protein